jgi:hypothetical protein
MQTFRSASVPLQVTACLLFSFLGMPSALGAAGAKIHSVTLGTARKVPYTPPASAPAPDTAKAADAVSMRVRPLFVDGRQKEWTTGEVHDVTDRSFTLRRALRLNDELPGETAPRWSWQPGPWLLVDRTTGHITALHLPDFDPMVSDVVWFRDYAAYCGTGTTAKGGLFAVVAQLGVRRPVVQKQIGRWPVANAALPVCRPAEWQRDPLRVTMQPSVGDAVTFDVVGMAALVEDGDAGEEQ